MITDAPVTRARTRTLVGVPALNVAHGLHIFGLLEGRLLHRSAVWRQDSFRAPE